MKMNLINVGKIALGAVLTLAGACLSSHAATCRMEVRVPGSIAGTSWVLVDQRAWPKYGGRVVYDNTRGCYVTDDVKRGERMRFTVNPISGESANAWFDIWCQSKNTYPVNHFVTLPCVETGFEVPLDTSMDNLYAEVWTNLGYFPFRIPIGPRP